MLQQIIDTIRILAAIAVFWTIGSFFIYFTFLYAFRYIAKHSSIVIQRGKINSEIDKDFEGK